jgi:hypothetical protein
MKPFLKFRSRLPARHTSDELGRELRLCWARVPSGHCSPRNLREAFCISRPTRLTQRPGAGVTFSLRAKSQAQESKGKSSPLG